MLKYIHALEWGKYKYAFFSSCEWLIDCDWFWFVWFLQSGTKIIIDWVLLAIYELSSKRKIKSYIICTYIIMVITYTIIAIIIMNFEVVNVDYE